MPELPDIAIYIEALERRILGTEITGIRIASPFRVRSVYPPIRTAVGHRVDKLHRLGKRIVLGLDGDLFLILHLMIAGRLQWAASGAPLPGKKGLAAFDFGAGTLILTEMGSKKRRPFIWCAEGRLSRSTIRAGSNRWRPTATPSPPPSSPRTTR